jgi:predicted DNA-binding transcriptional regulator AlpA
MISPSYGLNSPEAGPRLIDVKAVGRLLGCSWRTVLRHADAGRIPWGVKLGALRRWDAAEIDAFIANGCKMLKGKGRGTRS